ncbi:MAG: hypothetical protein QXH40_04975 [Candidatus Bathyarchaeia archaeon]
MTFFHDFVGRVVNSLEKVGIHYAFTGALAASFYGVPRTTVDVDVIVFLQGESDKVKLVSALRDAGLDADTQKIEKALRSGYRIASFKDGRTPYTLDVILSERKFKRRSGRLDEFKAHFQTPEDLVLAKLRMIRATMPRERAQKDIEDIKAILKFTKVDIEAVRKQAKKEDTLQILEDLVIK